MCTLDTESDALNVLHKISQHKLKEHKYNELRPFLLADQVEYEPDKLNPYVGTLKLAGYLRSRNLNANRLVHLPSIGTFQISKIEKLKQQLANGNNKMDDTSNEDEIWELVQQADPAKQDSLEQQAQYDEMNAEQTWPNEDELKEAELKAVKKKVPKGTSDYQAAWILDSEEETDEEDDGEEEDDEEDDDDDEEDEDDDEDDDEEEEEEEEEDENNNKIDNNNNNEDMETAGDEDEANGYDDKIDYDEDAKTYVKYIYYL